VPIIADGGIHDDKDIFLALICAPLRHDSGVCCPGPTKRLVHSSRTPARRKAEDLSGMTSPQAVFDALYSDEVRGRIRSPRYPGRGPRDQVPYKGLGVSDRAPYPRPSQSAVSYAGEETLRPPSRGLARPAALSDLRSPPRADRILRALSQVRIDPRTSQSPSMAGVRTCRTACAGPTQAEARMHLRLHRRLAQSRTAPYACGVSSTHGCSGMAR